MAADVDHRLRRERAPSSAAEVHEDRLCPDLWQQEYEGDEYTCSYAYDGEGPSARVARLSGKTSQILVRDAVAASEQPAVRAVATRLVMASSSFQAH